MQRIKRSEVDARGCSPARDSGDQRPSPLPGARDWIKEPLGVAAGQVQMTDLIFVSLENWDEIWRRNQFVCAELAHRYPERKILFVGVGRNVGRSILGGDLRELVSGGSGSVPECPNITLLRPLRLGPERFAWGRRLNEWITRRHIRRVSHDLGLRDPMLWLNPHYSGHLVGRLGERAVIYDITDDWTLATLPDRERRLVETQDTQLCGAADLVIVCSEALAESRRGKCRNLQLLPNGVHVEHYGAARENGAARPWPGPVFGYAGTLHPDRIDVDLVLHLARSFPQGSVVLLGPDNLDDAAREKLGSERNIHLPGSVPYAELPRRIAQFDVCIVPHLQTPFTESLNPIKLWEYLACAKPIVSTAVAGFRDYPELCHIGAGPEAFVASCRAALHEDPALPERRLAEARRHTWSARVDTLLAHLQRLGRAA